MKIYITFGQVHIHSVNGKIFNKDSIAVIEAESESAGRARAFEMFGPKWHQSIPETDWKAEYIKYFPRGFIEVEEIRK